MSPKPKPIVIVCTECGLAWSDHQPDKKGAVTLTECVRLLKAELAKPKAYLYGNSCVSTGNGYVSWTTN